MPCCSSRTAVSRNRTGRTPPSQRTRTRDTRPEGTIKGQAWALRDEISRVCHDLGSGVLLPWLTDLLMTVLCKISAKNLNVTPCDLILPTCQAVFYSMIYMGLWQWSVRHLSDVEGHVGSPDSEGDFRRWFRVSSLEPAKYDLKTYKTDSSDHIKNTKQEGRDGI